MTSNALENAGGLLAIAGGVVLLALLGWALSSLERRRAGRLDAFADSILLARLVSERVLWLRRPLNALVVLGAAFLLLALAQPRWGGSAAGDRRGSREILIVLDTSESMNAANPAPSRLARAQSKVSALLEACPGDRFALIAFSGAAVLQCPFTRDHAYFKTVLQSVTTDTLTEEGTNIEAALEEAARLFEDERGGAGAAQGDRMLLLISDGESSQDGVVALARGLSASSRIAVMGIGDPGGAEVTLPQWMERSRNTPGGAGTHWSALDEAALSSIALAGNGVYVRSTLGGEDLDVIQREMAHLDGIIGPDGAPLREVNRYRWPLAAAICCFGAEGIWLVCMPSLSRRAARRRAAREAAHAMV